MTYALGRGIEPSDGPAIRKIVRESAKEGHLFSAIISELVKSDPFVRRMSE